MTEIILKQDDGILDYADCLRCVINASLLIQFIITADTRVYLLIQFFVQCVRRRRGLTEAPCSMYKALMYVPHCWLWSEQPNLFTITKHQYSVFSPHF